MKSILDPGFKYTHSSKTDLKKTFARIRRVQAEEKAAEVVESKSPYLVTILKRKEGK